MTLRNLTKGASSHSGHTHNTFITNYFIAFVYLVLVQLALSAESSSPTSPVSPRTTSIVDIIITCKTNLFIFKQCIDSVIRYKPNRSFIRQRVTIVDDGSSEETLEYQRSLCKEQIDFTCLSTSRDHRGYTVAIQTAIRDVISIHRNASSAIVLLNSDTVVTRHWLSKLHRGLFEVDKRIMIVGPLSNAASYQSVPRVSLPGNSSSWDFNYYPLGLTVNNLAYEVQKVTTRLGTKPAIPIRILNGFCFMFRTNLINNIGNFDVDAFQHGYGEEVDFSLRALRAGYMSAIIPGAYVYHRKTSSFTTKEREMYTLASRKYLVDKYGKEIFVRHSNESARIKELEPVRSAMQSVYRHYENKYNTPGLIRDVSILFVLHGLSLSGGVISVLQEVLEMYRYGINAAIALPNKGDPFQMIESLFPEVDPSAWRAIIILHEGQNLYPNFPLDEEFFEIAKEYDIVVATFHKTAKSVELAWQRYPHILPAYYVQDYEPWFYTPEVMGELAVNTTLDVQVAKESYELCNRTMFMFAKTQWIADMVRKHHGVKVHRVVPSLDHSVYYPDERLNDFRQAKSFDKGAIFQIVAMIRPRTAVRNPLGTLDILLRLAHVFPRSIKIVIFGTYLKNVHGLLADLIKSQGAAVHRSKALLGQGDQQIRVLGPINNRKILGDLYRKSDMFLDLSLWQGFGRSAAEAMASGCIPLVPQLGAGPELCHFGGCITHDAVNQDKLFDAIVHVLSNDTLRVHMIRQGFQTTRRFSLEEASASMASTMTKFMIQRNKQSRIKRPTESTARAALTANIHQTHFKALVPLPIADYSSRPVVDIIITTRTNLTFVRECVQSLVRHAPNRYQLQQRVIFVDDGSQQDTIIFEQNLCKESPYDFHCLSTSSDGHNHTGYTHAINKGIEYGNSLKPKSEVVVLLNSDTIVANNWLEHLYEGLLEGGPHVAIAGPLSNAATYQSVPHIYQRMNSSSSGMVWNMNALPPGLTIDAFAIQLSRLVDELDIPGIIPSKILNGFCFMFKRKLLNVIGNFDAVNFPKGYGEEVDFSLRALMKGYHSVVVTRAYVFHHFTASFSQEAKAEQGQAAKLQLQSKYGKRVFRLHTQESEEGAELAPLRNELMKLYHSYRLKYRNIENSASILFVLHDIGASGGIICVLEEALYMRKLGLNVSVSVPLSTTREHRLQQISALFPSGRGVNFGAAGIDPSIWQEMIITHTGKAFHPAKPTRQFLEMASTFDIVVATFFKTMINVETVVAQYPYKMILPAYYVQDYEPWFFYQNSSADLFNPVQADFDNPLAVYARSTYEASDREVFMISKTHWLAGIIDGFHHMPVTKVVGSLNTRNYYPNKTMLHERFSGESAAGRVFVIAAMVRPKTPRRNPLITLEIVLRLAHKYPRDIKVILFGTERETLSNSLQALIASRGSAPYRSEGLLFGGKNIKHYGLVQSRQELADIYRTSDLFVDASLFQAFGQIAIDAMACGCIPLMPTLGAAPEICEHDLAILCQPSSRIEAYVETIEVIMKNMTLRESLVRTILQKSVKYSMEEAAASMAAALTGELVPYRIKKAKQLKRFSARRFFSISSGDVVFEFIKSWRLLFLAGVLMVAYLVLVRRRTAVIN